MEDVERVVPQEPITPVVGLPEVGTLPEGFATFDYPNVWFTGDKVYLTYHRSWVEVDEDAGEAVTSGGTEREGEEAARDGAAHLSTGGILPLKYRLFYLVKGFRFIEE